MPDATARHCQESDAVSIGSQETYQTEGLCDQGPSSQESPDDEASQDRLDLRDTAMLGVDGVLLDQHGRSEREGDLQRA